MFKTTVAITFDPARLPKALRTRWQDALPGIAGQVLADCNRYARDDTGALIGSAFAASDLRAGRLVWRTRYARRVYYTGTPSTARNPGASLRWCEKAKSCHAGSWTALAAKKLGGG